VTAVAFSQDGRHILTGSEDGTARLWEASTGRGTGVMRGARSSIKNVAFSGDGARAMVLSHNGTMRLYAVFATLRELAVHADAALPRRLTRTQRRQFSLDLVVEE
jgi:WD40 repeat protein